MLSLIVRNKSRGGLNFALQRFNRQVPATMKQTSPIQYEKKTPLEHVLLRPGMYVGAVEWSSSTQYVPALDDSVMVRRSLELSPALLKLFDEILVNAADNHVRTGTTKTIKVQVAKENYSISVKVENDGGVIPIDIHEKEGLHIPELIFGHLLTGSNFNDNDSRFTGGSHGYGAKLANIFSHSFTVDITNNGKRYSQNWEQNMSICHPPTISTVSKSHPNSVSVSFTPDLSKLGVPANLSKDDLARKINDIESLFKKRVYDIAGCLPFVQVFYNEKQLAIRSFADYVQLYCPTASENTTDTKNPKNIPNSPKIGIVTIEESQWQIGLTLSPSQSLEVVSFVNNVYTPRGGTHVNIIVSQLTQYVEALLAKDKLKATSTSFIKDQFFLVLSSKIENPSFDGQTKESLLTKPSTFAKSNKLSKEQLQSLILDTNIYATIKSRVLEQQELQLLSLSSKLNKSSNKNKSSINLDVPKLEDAHLAGSSRSLECTLILTEGDSAKALAVAGLSLPSPSITASINAAKSTKKKTAKNSKSESAQSESSESATLNTQLQTSDSDFLSSPSSPVTREFFGVMPLRGKLLNVRGLANHKQLLENEEIINLIKALNLDFKSQYTEGKTGLRYGKVMIMTDQDHDGSHIKGLLINFFHTFWPHLLQNDGFLLEFITPIIKLKPRNKSNRNVNSRVFYSMSEFKNWQREEEGGHDLNDYYIKYYKGLGTSTSQEGQEYFRDFQKHAKMFISQSHDDTRDCIDLIFNKNRVFDRKSWLLSSYNAEVDIDHRLPKVDFVEFVNKEFIHFSFADNLRSIPSVIDGLKPSQRKVLFGSFKRNFTRNEELKVVQLAGYIAEQTAYHHGEASLHQTIINMAQDFVGANNVPLLQPIGQFGTRAKGGTDFASPRYIFTNLSPLARLIFPAEDDALLAYQDEDGIAVEPTFYLPIIPFLLVNGSSGIGTGWSTTIPPYNPLDLIDCVVNKIEGKSVLSKQIHPWIAGFHGQVTSSDNSDNSEQDGGINYLSTGVASVVDSTTIDITELPYGKWTEDYKDILLQLMEKGKIKSFKELHSADHVHFQLICTRSELDKMTNNNKKADNLVRTLKLQSNIKLTNMHAFNADGQMTKYDTPEEIIDHHFQYRQRGYTQRKVLLEANSSVEEEISRNKSRFIDDILSGRLIIAGGGKRMSILAQELSQAGFATLDQIHHKSRNATQLDFDYLLNMPLQSLTLERAVSLRKKAETAAQDLQLIKRRSAEDMWKSDLEALRKSLLSSSDRFNKR